MAKTQSLLNTGSEAFFRYKAVGSSASIVRRTVPTVHLKFPTHYSGTTGVRVAGVVDACAVWREEALRPDFEESLRESGAPGFAWG